MPDGPGTGGEQGDLVARLRAVVGAKDEQITALTASLEAALAALEGERERRQDRKRGGQSGHQGKGLEWDPDPDDTQTADPPAECRTCRASLDGADAVEPRWAQVIDVEILRKVTEWALPIS